MPIEKALPNTSTMKTVHTTSTSPSFPSSTKKPPKTFLSQVTLDHIARVLRNSIFHPFITLLLPLCLKAQATPNSHPAFISTTIWAILVSAYHILASVNSRAADGPPREFDWEDQIVVITGGASGLGRLFVEVLALKRVEIAVLDVKSREEAGWKNEDEEEEEWGEDVKWYQCDVGNSEQLENVAKRIREDLGPPTILINNAASPISPLPLSSLSASSITQTLHTNLHSAFHLTRLLLPSILSSPTGGHIVTISSILAHFAPAHLTAYSASKAGLSALHASLSQEIRSFGKHGSVKTTLVETGQLATDLFEGLETPSGFAAPVVETREVVGEVVRGIENGEGGVIRLPEYAKWVAWYGVLPEGVKVFVRWLSGVDAAVGRMREKREGKGKRGDEEGKGVKKG